TASVGTVTKTGTNSGTWSWSLATTDGPNQSGTVTIFGDDGLSGPVAIATFALTVTNVAPTLGALTITGGAITAPNPMPLGTAITASANYTDPGTLDTQTCTFTWDDGTPATTVPGSAAGSGSCAATHTYASPGVYQVTLTVTDKDGAPSNTQVFQYVTIFDVNGGFITGGGWTNPTPGTRANFGFNARYLSNGTLHGQNEFNFQEGGLNFHGTVNNYLVITPLNRAQYQATGTVNAPRDYPPTVPAGDNPTPPGCRGARYRLKITSGATVVFDNGSGSDDVDTCPPPITQGNVVVHSGALLGLGSPGGGP